MLSLSLSAVKASSVNRKEKQELHLEAICPNYWNFLVDFFKMLQTLLLRIVVLDIFDYHDRPRQVTILRIISKLCETKTAFVD